MVFVVGEGKAKEAATFDEFSMQQSLFFKDSLKDLKNLRSQLYSAAEFFELSYCNDDQNRLKALVNTVDHLGSVSYKVNGLIGEKVERVSSAEVRVSCIEQSIDNLLMVMFSVGESMPESGTKATAVREERSFPPKEDIASQQFGDNHRTSMRDRPPSFRKMRSISPSASSLERSTSRWKGRSPSPSPRPRRIVNDKRAVSPLQTSNPLSRSGSLATRPTNSSHSLQQFPVLAQKSCSMRLHTERNDSNEKEQLPSKSKSFLKTLLSRRKSRKDEMLYSYIDEY
ncbi:hypothetical protein HPP92_021497 [Vanilla planifolia]|uniref:Uncharacterized protein n=1 Tax=Vanilla planifolia TaxID=51239 RepID=A0A835UHM1_VANPL|nr:hypothetical protein HPP92_021497 [Vanilla planifolia]